jgi:tetratricopeptide (TPR) repeat protein
MMRETMKKEPEDNPTHITLDIRGREARKKYEEATRGVLAEYNKQQQRLKSIAKNQGAHHAPEQSLPYSGIKRTAIFVADLMPHVKHTGRILRGKVITPTRSTMNSVSTLIQDDNNGVIEVKLEGFWPPTVLVSLTDRFPAVDQIVSIADPLCTIFQDGSFGIRIDDLSELTSEDTVQKQTTSVEEWRQEGNALFKEKKIEAALHCYTTAIEQVDKDRILCSLLYNIATTYPKIKDDVPEAWKLSIQYAAAALLLDPAYTKARARVSTA